MINPVPSHDCEGKLACSEPAPKPGSRKGCSRKGIWRKNTSGCTVELTLSLFYLCGCCRPASGHTVRWVRGDQQLANSFIKSRKRQVQRKCGFSSRFTHFICVLQVLSSIPNIRPVR